MPKVVIIGAGPAGCTAAIVLARAGIDITLVEQHRFPRDKVCGECLSALGIDVLVRLRLSASLQSLHPVELHRSLFFSPDGAHTEISLPRPMWGITRFALDEFLLNAARDAGAAIIQPARCESVHPSVLIRKLDSNQIETLEADWVLRADGKGAPTGDFGLKAHFEQVDAPHDAIGLFGVCGHYGGVAPIERGRWNVAFSVPEERIRNSRGDLDRLFGRIVTENAELARQMRRAVRTSAWLVSPLPRFGVQRTWPERVIPIGNAAAAVEPIGGEGIGLAMRSAELAAAFLIQSIEGDCDLKQLRAEYRRLWTLRRFACRAAAMAVSSPKLACTVAGFVQDGNPLTALALRLVGKASEPAAVAAPRPVLPG